ncbi:MAG: hypothetical protein ABSG33_05485 [Candidatus Bathyarchaeia archaeon]
MVFFEKGKQDIDYWYYWSETPLLKEDYEPVRLENAATGSTDRVLTRWGWNHKYWEDLLFVDGKIEVVFMGPGKTPFVRENNDYNQIVFKAYLKTHPNLAKEANSKCVAGHIPAHYKTPGKKLHFPDIVKNYGGWPTLR